MSELQPITRWFKAYGFKILAAILVVAIAIIGYRTYQDRQRDHRYAASLLYDEIGILLANDNTEGANTHWETLKQDYADTAYPSVGALSLAKFWYEAGNASDAADALQWVLDSTDGVLREAAADRLARLYIDQEEPAAALTVIRAQLDTAMSESVTANFNMLLGDALLLENNQAGARTAYETARQNLPERSPLSELITLKINNI